MPNEIEHQPKTIFSRARERIAETLDENFRAAINHLLAFFFLGAVTEQAARIQRRSTETRTGALKTAIDATRQAKELASSDDATERALLDMFIHGSLEEAKVVAELMKSPAGSNKVEVANFERPTKSFEPTRRESEPNGKQIEAAGPVEPQENPQTTKPRRGRPAGSKNKPKIQPLE